MMNLNVRRGGFALLPLIAVLILASCDKKDSGEQAPTTEAATPAEGTPTEAAPTEAAPTPAAPTEAAPTPAAPVAAAAHSIDLAPGFSAITQAGRVSGTVEASEVHGDECLGTISAAPNYTLNVTQPVRVQVGVVSETDTTLVVVGPGGPYCNDDYDGLNPGLIMNLAVGGYAVFVGTYSADEGGAAYTFNVAEAAQPAE